jgi:hypothetical protein
MLLLFYVIIVVDCSHYVLDQDQPNWYGSFNLDTVYLYLQYLLSTEVVIVIIAKLNYTKLL